MTTPTTPEHGRLQSQHDGSANWRSWGPYLSERAWGTVREDYSTNGAAWDFFPHDHARSKAYRWGEDGLAGISDERQYLCFALALWNGRDPILKERLFGLSGPEGNHGEDVKEYYFYLDSTPTHSYMKLLYKYPQAAFPYSDLVTENQRRNYRHYEYELLDTGIFDDDRYFDVMVEYAKAAPDDLCIRISVTNRAPEAADIVLLPTLWFRNTWAWGYANGPMMDVAGKPRMHLVDDFDHQGILTEHPLLGAYTLYIGDIGEVLFTENETNVERLYGQPDPTPYVKDAFHRYIVDGEDDAVNPVQTGTKAAPVYRLTLGAGETQIVQLRLMNGVVSQPFNDFDDLFATRIREADAYFTAIHGARLDDDQKRVGRQALAGMLWNKQLFYYDVEQWLVGDPISTPPAERLSGRNRDWKHLNNFDIISMPDKWEYPWYAAWDMAFHMLPLGLVDCDFAKAQLVLLTREWYMHPNGQLPAYEWAFSDVNPPVHAWAALCVYQMDGGRDHEFLQRIFNKMLLNFTWWVNRKDVEGRDIFQGGFLGLDNISLFDRSNALPTGGYINQSDGTAWMGFYCLTMMRMSIELAKHDSAYEDMAIKFYEHFLRIAAAMSGLNRGGMGLWDEDDGFFYDTLRLPDGQIVPLKVRSLVGLMPLIAVETVSQETLDALGGFSRSLKWMNAHRPHLTGNLMNTEVPGDGYTHIFSIPTPERLKSVLRYMLDEEEFLSPYGIRSLSKIHDAHPYSLTYNRETFTIHYEPAESHGELFGGNSNWRGPIWFPINYLLIEALRKYHRYFGDDFTVECPTGSGQMKTLAQVADDLAQRLTRLFLRDESGNRPVFGGNRYLQNNPHWRDHIPFYEYFHGDNGAGLGASHQTGWTGLVANLLGELSQPKEE